MGLSRGNTELVSIFQGKVLTVGGMNSINEGFPIGEAFNRFLLRVNIAVTIGTGTTPISEGELNILKSLTLTNSRGWELYKNCNGRALYRLDQIKRGIGLTKDAIAAATATYSVLYNLWLVDPLMIRPEDFILDSSFFNKLQLDLTIGTVADLFSTVGTSSIIVTADLIGEKVRGRLPAKVKPKEYTCIFQPSPVNPASATELNFERSENLLFKRILVQASNSVTAGQGFSGTPANTTIDKMGVDSDRGELMQKIPFTLLNRQLKDYLMEAEGVGYVTFDFCRDKSKMSGIISGLYSRLRLFWDNGTLSTSQVSAIVDAVRQVM